MSKLIAESRLNNAAEAMAGLLKQNIKHSDVIVKEAKGFLEHYGVLGMKWGVRKGSSSKGSNKVKKKSVKDMSVDELQKKVNRLNLEKRYRDLSPKKKSTGKAYVKKIIGSLADQAIKRAGSKLVNAKIDDAMDKVLGTTDGPTAKAAEAAAKAAAKAAKEKSN